MSRSVCGICFCPYGDDGECAFPATLAEAQKRFREKVEADNE